MARIVFVSIAREGGGAERSTKSLLTEFQRRDVSSTWISIQDFEGGRILRYLRFLRAIRVAVRNAECAVSAVEGLPYLLIMVACFGLKRKIVLWLHCVPEKYLFYQTVVHRFQIMLSIALAKNIVTVNAVNFRYKYCLGKNLAVIPNAFNNCYGLTNAKSMDDIKFFWVGSLSPLKQPILALQYYNYCKKKEVSSLHFFGSGPLSNVMFEYIKDNCLERRVFLEGYVSDPWSFNVGRKILLLSSSTEAAPMVILEAISRAIPVIANKFFGYEFLSYPSSLVIFVDFNNFDEVDKAVSFFIDTFDFAAINDDAKVFLSANSPQSVFNMWVKYITELV